MANWEETPAYTELESIFSEQTTKKLGLTAEQLNMVLHNIRYLKNHLGLADIEVGNITTEYTAPGTPFSVDIFHREESQGEGINKVDYLDFVFHIAVAKITAEMTVERVKSDTLTDMTIECTELTGEDLHKGFHFTFHAKLPKSGVTKEEISDGNEGDVLYVNPNGLPYKKQIMDPSPIVRTTEELNSAMAEGGTSFADILANWGRFSHFQGNFDDAIPSDMNGWAIDSTTGSITNSINSNSHIGFYSPDKVLSLSQKAKFIVTDASYKSHLDTLTLVAAFCGADEQINTANLNTENNHEHTLSFMRSPGPMNGYAKYGWALMVDLDFGYDSLQNENSKAFLLCDGTNFVSKKYGNGLTDWSDGVYVKVVRQGNVFTGYTSEFDDTELLEETKIQLNLDAMTITTKDGVVDLTETLTEQQLLILANFKQANHWGYGSASQPYCLYEQQGGVSNNEKIYDIENNNTYEFNPNSATWQATGISPVLTLGAGRFARSLNKDSLYYNDGTTIYQVIVGGEAENNKVDEITDDNKNSTELYPSVKATVDYVSGVVTSLVGDITNTLTALDTGVGV